MPACFRSLLLVTCFSFCAGVVLQALEELSCHGVWLQCLLRCQGEWYKPYPAAQHQLQPLLLDLKVRRLLSNKQLANIKHLYADVPVRIQAHFVEHCLPIASMSYHIFECLHIMGCCQCLY